MQTEPRSFTPDALQQLAARVFEAAGAPADTAALVANALVDAHLAGRDDSHGVQQVLRYVPRIRKGDLRPAARPTLLEERGATALVSGEWGFGQLAGRMAMEEAIARAKQYGVAAVGIVRTSHLGRLGAYVEQAADAGCVAFAFIGGLGGQFMAAPFGGSGKLFGTNPLAAAVPAGEAGTVLLDFATTAVAGGKVLLATASGTQLPPGSIVDRDGNPTTNPADYMDGGAMLPFGAHKGYGLMVLVELLGTALTGADRYAAEGIGDEPFQNSGTLFIALDVGAFRPAEDAVAASRRIVERIRAVPPAAGFDRVRTPGEPEADARARRTVEGIKIPADTYESIVKLGASLGLDEGALRAI